MRLFLYPSSLGLALLSTLVLGGPADKKDVQGDKKQPVATYMGAKSCKKCHSDQYKSWKKTTMAKSFEVLLPGKAEEAKKKAGLDLKKDYTKDKTCLPCHTTGYGKPGGYAIPPEGDSSAAKKLQKKATAMQGVQCEACHGPGSLSSKYKKKHEKYKWSDLVDKKLTDGVKFPDKENCLECHNDKSPTVKKGYVFDYDKRKDEGMHKHPKMDFKHGCPHTHTVSKKKKKKKKK